MKRFLVMLSGVVFLSGAVADAEELTTPDALPFASGPTVIVVRGAVGTTEYERRFDAAVNGWRQATAKGQGICLVIGQETADVTDRERLRRTIGQLKPTGDRDVWLVLIGHGSDDHRTARFHLRGPDVSATDLATWLEPIRRRTIVVNGASASGRFAERLSGPDRIILTATQSGAERQATRFGTHFAEAIAQEEADRNRDGETSLREAWLHAKRQVEESYRLEGRLATEHSRLEDSEGGAVAARVSLVPSEADRMLSPARRAERDRLEGALTTLRDRKASLSEEEYFTEVERLCLRLAEIAAGE